MQDAKDKPQQSSSKDILCRTNGRGKMTSSTLLIKDRTSPLNVSISMEHAHPSYANRVLLHMSLKDGSSLSQNFGPKLYTNT